ncbi:EAL domain-containing protein [Sporosarcina luteola]|uniref:putative bifunctional diguanylate cyclase/phosphodiesterase n=1 Tax=Sporosarcina luteola TaxID=582850 RepID=UPI00203CBD1C|nr:GGDEF domain-containing phosphodiesterase [Sporosarcina luteola]MCM3744854.1 EAL domain-containing protein [Sporosarcina luteola]
MHDYYDKMRKITGENNQQEVEKILADIAFALDQSVIIAMTDRTGKITYVNELFTNISKYEAEELIGATHSIVNSGYHSKEFFKNMWSTIGSGKIWHGEICNRAKDGSFYWVDTKIVPFLNERGIPNRYISIRYNITKRKLMEEKIRKDAENYRKIVEENRDLAYNDQLTSLLNRNSFGKELRAVINEKFGWRLGVVYLNIDRLRNVNDSFGQETGDYVLSIVAKRLKKVLCSDDIIGRISGDEFAFTLTEASNEEKAKQLMEKIKACLESPISINDETCTISTSSGIALFPKHAKTASELIMKAEKALHYVKERGGRNYRVYEPGTATKTLERILLEHELRKSVQMGHFTLEYQPKMNLSRGKLSGIEALVRWDHPDLGRIPPNKFIPLAEETKIILPLGEWVLREACKQAVQWKRQGYMAFRLAVNMSTVQLEDPDIVESIKRILFEEKVEPELIEIELTESSFADRSEMRDAIERIRDLGMHVSIDDFGTGYSTFSYIKELPADTVKIDMSFVKDIEVNENSRAIVKAIITLADTAGLNVIAEGIETEEQANILHKLGCREGQGYFFSKPLSPADCELLFLKSGENE